jgi:hypothetical protein
MALVADLLSHVDGNADDADERAFVKGAQDEVMRCGGRWGEARASPAQRLRRLFVMAGRESVRMLSESSQPKPVIGLGVLLAERADLQA